MHYNLMPADLDHLITGCKHFRWREALWLPTWKIHVFPDQTESYNIVRTARRAERIREILGAPMNVTSWLRPALYNVAIGGAAESAHLEGMAIDFQSPGKSANEIRALLKPHLSELDIRIEDLPDSNWVHFDLKPPGPSGRYFKP